MRHIAITICTLFFGLFSIQSAQAVTALEMSSFCRPIDEATLLSDGRIVREISDTASQCWGAFLAIQGATRIVFKDEPKPALNICAPEESSLIQFVKIFRAYVAKHPDRGHEDFFAVAFTSLFKAFPCHQTIVMPLSLSPKSFRSL